MKLSGVVLSVAANYAYGFVPLSGTTSRMILRADNAMEASEIAGIDPEIEQEPEPEPEPVDIFSTPEELPGVISPTGFFDPFGLSKNADAATMRRYREAELAHGRVGMLAVLGFFAGEYVEGSSFLFNAEVSGPAITHLEQVPTAFWILLTVGIGASESERLNIGWVDPKDVPVAQAGLLRTDYTPGDINFDPFGLKPTDPAELKTMQTKELQNGRLGMLAAAGFLAQELASGKGILDNLGLNVHL